MVGIVVASYGLPQVLFRIPMGMWFDNIGRWKPLVAGGIVITVLGVLGLGVFS
jgi:MFS family permease